VTRIALLADVHGNTVALDAVLSAIGTADEYWFLGDLVALGPDPVGVLERIDGLSGVTCIRGNTDRYVVSMDRPRPTLDEALADPAVLEVWKEVHASFFWTQGAVTAALRLGWLDELPLEIRRVLPDGTRVLGVHASPGRDDGHGAHPSHTDDDLASRFGAAEADLAVVGHTHAIVDRVVDGVRIVNPGPVSNPTPGPDDARFAIVEAGPHGHAVDLRAVPYDRAAVIDQLERVRHPSRDYLRRHFEG
jgi:predicted phosphodiesterase